MTWIYLLNVLSRWILFGVAAYKTHRERSVGWMFLMAAFLLAALDPERLLLGPLGLQLDPEASFILDMVSTSLQGVLFLLAAEYLHPTANSFRNSLVALLVGIAAYTWIVFTNVSDYNLSFTLRALFPVLLYGAGYIYLSILLYRRVVSRRLLPIMFPAGMFLLGALNLTYPVTATWRWFLPYGFLLGTIFRLLMAIGALGYAFWPFNTPAPLQPTEIPAGAFVFSSWNDVLAKLGDVRNAPNLVLVTREDFRKAGKELHPNALVFWVTRAAEGQLSESPSIYAISPGSMDILTHFISRALDENYRIIIFDAFEYLVLENGFEKTFRFLLNIKDRVLLKNGTIVLLLNPESLEEREVSIVKREFEGLR
ncbi:DUF835 domain-containing protein [Thermococcus sp.]|uniref:DUF835 domain-containing protein n=1 Tax=Thermococcus sp. TaxID=35749 RepID=UPI0026031046|nr:DUF835 domain-containing protein [Thermococcus sp.]